jgi:hypothetical protein
MATKRNQLDLLLDDFAKHQRESAIIKRNIFQAKSDWWADFYKRKLVPVLKKIKESRKAIHAHTKSRK